MLRTYYPDFHVIFIEPEFFFNDGYVERTLLAGTVYTLPGCEFRAFRPTNTEQTFWTKDGVRIQNVTGTEISRDFTRVTMGDLVFPSLKLSDAGIYRCGIYFQDFMDKPLYSDQTFNVTIKGLYCYR